MFETTNQILFKDSNLFKSKNSRKHFSNLDAAPGSAGQPDARNQRCLVTLLNGFLRGRNG